MERMMLLSRPFLWLLITLLCLLALGLCLLICGVLHAPFSMPFSSLG